MHSAWSRLSLVAALAGILLTACKGEPLPAPQSGAAATLMLGKPGYACHPIFYEPQGAREPEQRPLQGPGLVLGGGGLDVNDEFVWIHDTIVGAPAKRGGDLVVLRSTGNNDYDRYIYRLAPYHSVRTLLLPTCSDLRTLTVAASIVARSGAVFFAGGNQADYVIWKNSPIQDAVQYVYNHGGVVGGTSAGEAILGKYVFDAVAERNRNTTTHNAVHNPWEKIISFTYHFLAFPILRDVITDQHFVTRNRFGRTAVFMARQIAEDRVHLRDPVVLGVAVDEASGVVIDKLGVGRLLLQGKGGSAFLIRGGPAKQIVPGLPFISAKLTVTKMSHPGDSFDFNAWCGAEPTYEVTVDGTQTPIYSPANPYQPPRGSRIPKCGALR